ncbi:MAG: hypothetical protein IH989_08315 [Planctomycetes bacterium]|nr:hypothetical protein [Planctomycetota bacterium]
MKNAARSVVCKAGKPARTAEPATLREAIQSLDDSYRVMLIHASRGDKEARQQAVATMPLWWDSMPQELRNNIDFRIQAFRAEHPGVSDATAAARKLALFLAQVRSRPRGPHW